FASKVDDNGGVYIVPAFVGLGAPHLDMYARGAIFGITRGTNRNHLMRAALESIAYQTRDLIDAMKEDVGSDLKSIKVAGGASRNKFLMQFQADLLGKKVVRPIISETTALGAAYLAGLAVGFWKDKEEVKKFWHMADEFDAKLD
ncbi:glycerol kinase, partial [Clostridium perfringens]|nr:glycerol kinase [Clostridium perfringens]